MSKSRLRVTYPKADDLVTGRFSFIDNTILQQNVAIAVQYISFLISLDVEYELGGAIQNSVYKNIVLLSASVAEGLINWKLHKMIEIDLDLKKKCCISKATYTEIKEICIDELGNQIWAVKKGNIVIPLDSDTDFKKLITYAERVGLLVGDLKKKADDLRMARNKIHLAGLKSVDNKYSKPDIDECFKNMKDIIDCIISK